MIEWPKRFHCGSYISESGKRCAVAFLGKVLGVPDPVNEGVDSEFEQEIANRLGLSIFAIEALREANDLVWYGSVEKFKGWLELKKINLESFNGS